MAPRRRNDPEPEEFDDPEDMDLEAELEDFDDLDEVEEETAPKPKAGKTGKAKPKPTGIGARQVAERLKVDAKNFRAWLRRRVQNGDFKSLQKREPKSRYTWASWTDPELVAIMEAYQNEDHTSKRGKKASGNGETPAKKAATTKKPAARRTRARKG